MRDYRIALERMEIKDGVLVWKYWDGMPNQTKWRIGSPVSTRISKAGNGAQSVRVCTRINGKSTDFLYHRLIYMLATKENIDDLVIDHINGNPLDNRLSNLRAVTQSVNRRNNKRQSNNRTGLVGIRKRKRKDGLAYEASIGHNGKQVHLGTYRNLDSALIARKEAEQRLGFSGRHWD